MMSNRRAFFGLVPLALSARNARGMDAADAPRLVLDRQVEAWNRGDLEGFMATYHRSPDTVFLSGGDRTAGFEAVATRYRRRYQGEGKEMGRLAFSEIEVLDLCPDYALARGSWKLSLKEGKRPHGLFTLILRRFDDGWRIVHDHTSSAPADV